MGGGAGGRGFGGSGTMEQVTGENSCCLGMLCGSSKNVLGMCDEGPMRLIPLQLTNYFIMSS